MKKILVLGSILLLANPSFAQTGRQVAQLATLGKLWGFLKYYHPAAAKGNPDWDSSLLRICSVVEKVTTRQAFSAVLNEWFNSLPKATIGKEEMQPQGDSIVHLFNAADIEEMDINRSLKNELLHLYRNHLPDSSRYITDRYRQYHLDFILHTEEPYAETPFPTRGMRLLSLFRYWNTIEYFYPHKSRLRDWDGVLRNYIPRFLAAADSMEYRRAVRQLIHELPDSHSFFLESEWQKRYEYISPFTLDYIQEKYLIAQCDRSISQEYDYKRGDEVIAINGKEIAVIERNLLHTTTGTNSLSLHRNVAQELLLGMDSVISVRFKRGKEIFEKKVELHSQSFNSKQRLDPSPPWWENKGGGVWYVRFCRITRPDTLRYLFRDIHDARAVIWEMRGYPNYEVTKELQKGLFEKRTLLSEELTANVAYPGSFTRKAYYTDFITDSSVKVYTGPLLVLVDEHTQSLSESVSSMLRARANTIVMGRQTAGTTGNITWLDLPGGIQVSYTGVGVVGVNGGFLQGRGVKLDIPIVLTPERMSQYGDYIYEQAFISAQNFKK